MEDWETIIDTYPDTPNLRFFTKAVKTAETVLKEDLAIFEAEWVTNTLFYKPVDLFNTVTSKRSDTPWGKAICDGFKLIGTVIEKYPSEHLLEDIVTLCLVQYTPHIRKDALLCLSKVVAVSSEGAREVTRLIAELEDAETCRSPLAVLVGSIAEHHPELVAEDVHKIWRIYLNLLESNKNTDAVISSVLQGLVSLFKHFGHELPVVEFKGLYDRLSKSYVLKKNCAKVCVAMLEQYSDLFKELLANDLPLRELLWSELYTDALASVYAALATAVDSDTLQRITDAELVPRTAALSSAVKYPALRITKHMVDRHNVKAATDAHIAVQVIDQELRNGNVSIDTADAILWCIESNCLYSDRLLQTAILFYNNIPSSKRKGVVCGFLNAKDEVRTAALTLLVNESCQPADGNRDNMEKYLPLWRDLFDPRLCGGGAAAARGGVVFTAVTDYVFAVLQSILDEDCETLPEKIDPLLDVTCRVLALVSPDERTEAACRRLRQLLRQLLRRCGLTASLVAAIAATASHCGDSLSGICQAIRIDKCTNESVLCESCHLLVQAAPGDVGVEDVLQALEILFTRRDVEPRILSLALQRFESILDNDDVNRDQVNHIIRMVNNLRYNTNTGSKEARIFHRDVIVFLGKYANESYVCDNAVEDNVIAKLENRLCLNILNTEEVVTYKVNLQRILRLAVVYEDADALQKLLAVISVNRKQCQVENYKCFCAAICLQRPAEKFYDYLFGGEVWARVVDCGVEHRLTIQSPWYQRRTFQTSSVELQAGLDHAGTVRTRMFLRTLSEDPLQYDLLTTQQKSNAQELELTINELNCQEVSGTLTALLKHASALTHHRWRAAVAETLVGGTHRNVKWTLAQVICNCKEDLSPHADVLRPALLEMVAGTPCDSNGNGTLNSLHVDALQTILFWENSQLPSTSLAHLTASVGYLINTAIDYGASRSVFNSLLATLKKLVALFEIFGQREFVWNGYEKHMKAPEKLKWLFQIALALSKQKLRVPNLLQSLSEMDDKCWSEPNLPELFGHVLSCEGETAIPLARFRRFLARRRKADHGQYVRILRYSQMGCPSVVDEANFKIVADLAPKLPGDSKIKCLNILAAYLENASETTDSISDMFDTIDICSLIQDNTLEALRIVKHGCLMMGDRLRRSVMSLVLGHADSSDVKIRKMALEVVAKVFEEWYYTNHSEPPLKKSKSGTSKLLRDADQPERSKVIKCVAGGLTDCDTTIVDAVMESVAKCLNTSDFGIRLAECYLLCVSSTRRQQDVAVCVSAFLKLLFRDLRNSPRFQELRLSDEPLEVSESALESSKLLTKSKTYCGTFLSSSRRGAPKKRDVVSSGINVQIPINDIVGTLFEFAENKPDVSQSLCVEVVKAVVECSGRGFDVGRQLSQLVCDVLSSTPSDITPLAIEVGRMFLDHVVEVPRFQSHLDRLRTLSRTAEGELLTTLLYEDVQLRTNDEIFTLGITEHEESMDVEELLALCLTDIMAAFGKLSDWDKLTLQQRRGVESSGLPQLWVGEDVFKSWLDEYEVPNTKSWFHKLIVTYRDECKQDSLRWLRETDRWPRRHFDLSTVAEVMQRSVECGEDVTLCCDIRPRDCLAEWAARIMIRRAYASDMDSDGFRSRDQELIWCRAANDRRLPRLAVNCIEVNRSSINTSEKLSWTIENARALRLIALDSGNEDLLKESLSMLESCQFEVNDSDADVILLNKLILTVNRDLGTVTKDKIGEILESIDQNTERQVSKKNKDNLWSLYEMAINFYDDEWEKEVIPKGELISNMADVLGRVIDLNLNLKAEIFLSVILNRLEDVKSLDGETSKKLLDKIDLVITYLDDFSMESLESNIGVFSSDILAKYPRLSRDKDAMSQLHKQLSLVRDPYYGLWRRCKQLLRDDPVKWKDIMWILKESIFENPYALESTEYRLLFKYKEDLYAIEKYESSQNAQRNVVLNKIIEDLTPKLADRSTLRLSQLCPALTRVGDFKSERDSAMSRLLRLGKLSVIKFYEQVSVFTNAETRPAVLKVLVSDGSTRKYIIKSGESLRLAAASQRACKAATLLWGEECFVGHAVTPLSGDSGLIGFLEDTITFRQLITNEHDLNATYDRLERFKVTTSPVDRYNTYCSYIPAYTLRSAVEKSCSSIEDFVRKKRRFLQTYCGLTLLGSMFGLGDRHLENLLYCANDGSACCIDWGTALQYCLTEPVPARLTRNVLALMPGTELESCLQRLLTGLRSFHKLFLHVVQLSFKWRGEEFLDHFNYISLFARGEATTYDITDISLSRADDRKKHEGILKILRGIFEEHTKRCYSVVEQINCLLRHCTHPVILAHTRDGWEPWI